VTKVVGLRTGGGGNVPTSGKLAGITALPVVSHSSTEVELSGSGTTVTFHGTGFSGFDVNGIPSAGTVTGLDIPNSDWSDMSVSFTTLWGYMQADNVSAFDNAIFSGDDTFVSKNHSLSNGEVYEGFGGNDTFNMLQASTGAEAYLYGDDGNDKFYFAGNFSATPTPASAADVIDGGTGSDTLELTGDYSSGLTFTAQSFVNIEKLVLGGGFNYSLTTDDGNVAAGKLLTVNATALGVSNYVQFDGHNESDGRFNLEGGNGNDYLTGGARKDTFIGGGGADHMDGGTSADTFVYESASDSPATANDQPAGSGFDTISGFAMAQDKIDLWFTVTGIDPQLNHVELRQPFIDTDLGNALGSSQLHANHAVIVHAGSGDYTGDYFLVIDGNGVAGYQAGEDLVIQLSSPSGLSHLSTSTFI